jgi:hypothetical protein
MKEQVVIETCGTILKKETIASIEQAFCAGILVLESKFPFPGYYHQVVPETEELSPGSVFLMLKSEISDEKLMRLNPEIKKLIRKRFDAAPGRISLFNEEKPSIRVKLLREYNEIPQLVELYKEEGVHFLKYRHIKPYTGLISVKKFFVLNTIEPGIYVDTEDHEMGYVQIPGYLKWSNFEKITIELKRNMEDNKFDAALATIHRKNCVIDLIRIFDKQISVPKLQMIRSKYIEAINKL